VKVDVKISFVLSLPKIIYYHLNSSLLAKSSPCNFKMKIPKYVDFWFKR